MEIPNCSKLHQGVNLGVDINYSFNQFGICADYIEKFENNIKPWSLVTYGDQGFQHLTNYGEYKDITALTHELCNYPLHIWPIGNYNCLASHITSFAKYKNNKCQEGEFIKEDFSLLAALCAFFYRSYLEMKNLAIPLDFNPSHAPSPQVVTNFNSVLNELSKPSSLDREIDKRRKAYSQAFAELQPKKTKIGGIKSTELEKEVLDKVRENTEQLCQSYQEKYLKILNGLQSRYGSIEEQIDELVKERQVIKTQIENRNQNNIQKQKNFYISLMLLDEEIKWENQKNPMRGFMLRETFLGLVKDILNDILTYKGFPKNSLNVLLQT